MTSNKKAGPLGRCAAKASKGPVLKPLVPRAKAKVLLTSESSSVFSTSLVEALKMSTCLQTQSTLLEVTAGKKKTEPASEQPPRAPPPAAKAEDAENKR